MTARIRSGRLKQERLQAESLLRSAQQTGKRVTLKRDSGGRFNIKVVESNLGNIVVGEVGLSDIDDERHQLQTNDILREVNGAPLTGFDAVNGLERAGYGLDGLRNLMSTAGECIVLVVEPATPAGHAAVDVEAEPVPSADVEAHLQAAEYDESTALGAQTALDRARWARGIQGAAEGDAGDYQQNYNQDSLAAAPPSPSLALDRARHDSSLMRI